MVDQGTSLSHGYFGILFIIQHGHNQSGLILGDVTLVKSLKGRIVQPPKTGLKCTSAAAPTLQQMVACVILPLRAILLTLRLEPC